MEALTANKILNSEIASGFESIFSQQLFLAKAISLALMHPWCTHSFGTTLNMLPGHVP